jgi:alkyl sulfatase BDS1-like metallo-beta-lactamase superfamily hydrolase
VVWDNGSYRGFLAGDAPDTVHPSLWRQQPGNPNFNIIEP